MFARNEDKMNLNQNTNQELAQKLIKTGYASAILAKAAEDELFRRVAKGDTEAKSILLSNNEKPKKRFKLIFKFNKKGRP